jgi:hypothetical protein
MLAGSPKLGIGFFPGGIPNIHQTQHGVVFHLVVVSPNSYPYYPEVNTGMSLVVEFGLLFDNGFCWELSSWLWETSEEVDAYLNPKVID